MAPSPETMKMMDDFSYIIKAMGAPMQFNIPGTSYHMALKKNQQILEALSSMVKKRRLEKSKENCLLDTLMEIENDNRENVLDDLVQCQLRAVIFAGSHSPAVLFVWLVKFLEENQKILEQVKAEQDAIRMAKISPEDPLSWTDVLNMPLTSAVIQETLRLANVASFVTRRATEDINYQGIWIPKGWLIQLDIRSFHLSPEYHKDPLKFDPSRFQEPTTKSAAFLPFGNGSKMCPGRGLVKFQALVFLHYLVTTYSWESIGCEKEFDYWPNPIVKGGLPIKISKLKSDCVT
ncbi:hypothetical protein O6H91_20G004100 [Diphasiastrum complanatum]|nr:hypothetical protein O6H91_20G004100 [Diphasiastrum complanatum]